MYLKDLQRFIIIGWKTYAIGVFPVSFGGDIVFPYGIAKTVASWFVQKKIPPFVLSAEAST